MHSRYANHAVAVAVAAASWACDATPLGNSPGAIIRVDGSSTVFPLTQAVVEEFTAEHPGSRVRVTISGTAAGFEHFCAARTDVGAAGRPIRRSEIEACHAAAVSFLELPIAYDGIAVVVHPNATWINDITVDELRALWQLDARQNVRRWNQIRAEWPNRDIHLFGADNQSGTYDYFTAAIIGEEGISRRDYTGSVDDEAIVRAIAGDELALGFLPLVYYEKSKHRLKIVAIDNGRGEDGAGPILPTPDTIRAGSYQPLARPVFIYIRDQALNRPGVETFVDFYLSRAGNVAERLGYMQLGDDAYALVTERRKARWTGSVFGEGGPQVGLTLTALLEKARLPVH